MLQFVTKRDQNVILLIKLNGCSLKSLKQGGNTAC